MSPIVGLVIAIVSCALGYLSVAGVQGWPPFEESTNNTVSVRSTPVPPPTPVLNPTPIGKTNSQPVFGPTDGVLTHEEEKNRKFPQQY